MEVETTIPAGGEDCERIVCGEGLVQQLDVSAHVYKGGGRHAAFWAVHLQVD